MHSGLLPADKRLRGGGRPALGQCAAPQLLVPSSHLITAHQDLRAGGDLVYLLFQNPSSVITGAEEAPGA